MRDQFKEGDIINVNLGAPPGEVKGHEQGYSRPCLIVKPFASLKLIVVIPCTSKTPKFSHYTLVRLASGSGGLSVDSFALCHQIRTISIQRVESKRGQLTTRDFLKVKAVLVDTLGL